MNTEKDFWDQLCAQVPPKNMKLVKENLEYSRQLDAMLPVLAMHKCYLDHSSLLKNTQFTIPTEETFFEINGSTQEDILLECEGNLIEASVAEFCYNFLGQTEFDFNSYLKNYMNENEN